MALSRATDHYRMYTSEDKKLLLKVLQDDGDKYSSLEVLREFITEKNREDKTLDNILFEEKKKDNQVTDNKNFQSNKEIKTDKQKPYFDKDKVLNALNENCENVVISLLGQPNQKYSDSKVWAFGSKTGSLRVTISGEYRGHWRDWYGSDTKGTSDHGNLLTLIMREEGLSFKEAVERGAELAYVTPEVKDLSPHLITKNNPKKSPKTFEIANKIWSNSRSIKGTLAEEYLKNTRSITKLDAIKNIRFNPRVYSSETKKNYPALVMAFKDKDYNLKGIEVIYLDNKTKDKAQLSIKKRSFGSKASYGVMLQDRKDNQGLSFIAEGVETSLSIRDVVGDNNHIMAISGKGNFSNINPKLLNDTVIICLDNDGIKTQDETINKAISNLKKQGKTVYTVMPNEAKSDFNDLLKEKGTDAVKAKIIEDIIKEFNINDQKAIEKLVEIIQDKSPNLNKNMIELIKETAEKYNKKYEDITDKQIQLEANKLIKEDEKLTNHTHKKMPKLDKKQTIPEYEISL